MKPSHRILRAPGRSAGPAAAGFSIVEVLIASVFLLGISLGLLPIFTRSVIDNASGNESTQVSNLGRSSIEEFRQLPFDSPRLTIDTGMEKVSEEYYSFAEKKWKPGLAPTDNSDPALWERTVTVRQYSAAEISDRDDTPDVLDPTEALPAGTPDEFIHVKEIELDVRAFRPGVLGGGKRVVLRILKSE